MSQLTRRLIVPTSGLVVLAIFIVLYIWWRDAYFAVLSFFGIAPFRIPFFDFQYILVSTDCWQQGINVYVADPCDLLGRRWDYSPLWLRAWFLPGPDLTNPLGLILVIAFFVSLAAFPPPRERRGLAILLAAVLSPRVAFAVERGNVDVLMFVLLAVTALLACVGVMRRMLAYGLVLFAGLLKFYPIIVLGIALRERPKVFVPVAAGAIAIVVIFISHFHVELVAAARNVPFSFAPIDTYGAINLPQVVGKVLRLSFAPALTWLALLAWVAWQIIRLVRWPEFRAAFTLLPPSEASFLIIGALAIVGTFAAGQNIGYRGIFLLFALPALTKFGPKPNDVANYARIRSYLIVFLMWEAIVNWGGPIPRFLDHWDSPFARAVRAALWLSRELIWWEVVGIFAGIIVCFTLDSLRSWRVHPDALKQIDQTAHRV